MRLRPLTPLLRLELTLANKLVEQVTREGALPLFNSRLNDAKLMEADRILQGIKRNENSAVQEFKHHLGARFGESISTTGDDFVFAFAQLAAFDVQNEWEAAERTWTEAIETEVVSSWDAPTSYSINPVSDGFERPQSEPNKPGHIVPTVPEGSVYPHFTFKGEEAASNGISKAGGRYDLTFERIISDVAGLVPQIPKLITESLLEREEYTAWQGLVDFIDVGSNHLAADTLIDGRKVVADAPLSDVSLAAALKQAKNREVVPGRKVQVSSYNLIVPRGEGDAARFWLNQFALVSQDRTDGLVTNRYAFAGYNPLSGIANVIETDYLQGTQWALIPAKGSVRGSKKFYALGQLAGHIGPEIRLQNVTGQYLGGGSVSAFEGSFDTDSASFRGRIISGGLGWNNQFAVISDGDGE